MAATAMSDRLVHHAKFSPSKAKATAYEAKKTPAPPAPGNSPNRTPREN